jgi:hypothetical protein
MFTAKFMAQRAIRLLQEGKVAVCSLIHGELNALADFVQVSEKFVSN